LPPKEFKDARGKPRASSFAATKAADLVMPKPSP
jgi:hypothetical protein